MEDIKTVLEKFSMIMEVIRGERIVTHCVLFLDIKLELDFAGHGVGYSELELRVNVKQHIKMKTYERVIGNEIRTPSSSLEDTLDQ
jgi:hypothetical protein